MSLLQNLRESRKLPVKENVKPVFTYTPLIEKKKNKPVFTLNRKNDKPVCHQTNHSSSTTPNTKVQACIQGKIARIKVDHRYKKFEAYMRLIFPNYSFCCYGEDKYDFELKEFENFARNYEKK